MTPATRATSLLVAALAGLCALAAVAAFQASSSVLRWREARRDAAPRHLAGRQPFAGVEAAAWVAGLLVRAGRAAARAYREDGAPKAAATFGVLFVMFAGLIGASQ